MVEPAVAGPSGLGPALPRTGSSTPSVTGGSLTSWSSTSSFFRPPQVEGLEGAPDAAARRQVLERAYILEELHRLRVQRDAADAQYEGMRAHWRRRYGEDVPEN